MPANYVLLEKITVGAAGAATVVFNSIPQTGYTDLVIKVSARVDSATATQSMAMAFNAAAQGSVWSQRWINSDGGTGAGSGSYSAAAALYPFYVPGATATANTFGNGEIYITNYSSTTQNKSVSTDGITENNASGSGTQRNELGAMLFGANNAVTSITLYGNTNFVQGSTFYLYGVAKLGTTPVIVPYATGGDIIDTDGTYWYHTFLSSGTFTPQKALTTDYLVVAGGGGGGGGSAGGGGAGGLRSTVSATGGGGSLESALSLVANTGYTVTIGAGGAKGAGLGASGSNGSNSVFSTITSTGGGAGSTNNTNGSSGGSGGGGGTGSGSLFTGGSGTTNQGYKGGDSIAASTFAAGGGGGAGSAGGNSSGSTAGSGGSSVNNSISGTSVAYAGGGGGGTFGGTAGAGGGGGATAGNSNTDATPNRGSGGGGSSQNSNTGGAGGSGIVVIRYAV
jgi:hypothetical protein